jgi:hypothetical protein
MKSRVVDINVFTEGLNLLEAPVSCECPFNGLLHAYLILRREASEFDAHADAGIACTNDCSRNDLLGIDPKNDGQRCTQRQWNLRLYIAATTANVGSIGLHGCVASVVANLDRKWNSESFKSAFAVQLRRRVTFDRLSRNLCRPRAFLSADQSNFHLGFVRQSCVACGYDFESRLFVLMLYPNRVTRS